MKEEQTKVLRELAEKIRHKYPKARIWAFGSYARDTAELNLIWTFAWFSLVCNSMIV